MVDDARHAPEDPRPIRGTAIVVRREVIEVVVDVRRGLRIREQRYRAGVARRYDARTGPWVWD